ncbi:MAG: hypothetical protein KDB63_00920 [Nocardioidaceae bacterium]|nr:hypothetical protein [Nocardioidaceae bacterium]
MKIGEKLLVLMEALDEPTLDDAVETLARRSSDIQSLLGQLLQDFDDINYQAAQAARLHETSTHFVWQLAGLPDEGVRIALNEYKSNGSTPVTYAGSLHDHRYDFASLILSGGYDFENYRVDLDESVVVRERYHLLEVGSVRCGEVARVPNELFHRLVRTLPNTVTLLIKLPPVKPASTSYDLRTGRIQRHVVFGERPRMLQSKLRNLLTGMEER